MDEQRASSSGVAQTILVVDDVDDVRLALRLWLEKRGFRVIEATNGTDAVAAAKRERPALVLMDIGIGPQSGIASVVQMREHGALKTTPVIALTAYDSNGLRLEASSAGINAYVTKPFDPEQLGQLIDRLLAESR